MKTSIFSSKFPELRIDENFILREQKSSDLEDFYRYFSDPIVSKYILSSIPTSLEEAKEEIKYWINLFYRREGIYFAIADERENKMIGAIGFHDLNRYNDRAEISYDLAKEYWGLGIMSKAMKQILKFGFETMEINRIQASSVKENINSIRLLEKNGFIREGSLRDFRFHMGHYYGIEMYAILRIEFLSHSKSMNIFERIWG